MQRDIKEIADLAIKYKSQELAQLVQQGLLDPTKAMMAGMMRKRIAADEMKPPETTVMQDVLGQPQQPQMGQQPGMQPENPEQMAQSGGMASLDAGNTGNYAGGGIIAFDDGGYVPGYAGNERDGSVTDADADEQMRRLDQKRIDARKAKPAETSSALGRLYRRLTDVSPEAEAIYEADQKRQRLLKEAAQLDPGLLGQETEEQRITREAAQARNLAELQGLKPETMGMQDIGKARAASAGLDRLLAAMPGSTGAATQQAAPTFKQVTSEKKTSGLGYERAAPVERGIPIIPRQTTGVSSLPAISPDVAKLTPQLNVVPESMGIKEAFAKDREAEQLAGFDENMYTKLRDTLSDKKDKLSQRKDEAAGLALMQASLGLMGARRGQEFQTLSSEAKSALSGYVSAVKDIRDNESKLEDKIADLNVAENQYRLTKSQSARARVDKKEEEIRNIEAKNAEIKNKAAADQAALETHLFGYTTQAQTSRYVADRNVAAHIISAASANKPTEMERRMAEYENIYKKQGPEAAKRYTDTLATLSGLGKPQNTFSFEEAMKIVAAKPKNMNASDEELAKQARALIALQNAPAAPVGGAVDTSLVNKFAPKATK